MGANGKMREFAGRAVRVISKNSKTAGVLVRDEVLDASGETVSVLGCKSGIPGRTVGEVVLITLANNIVIPATITHIHAVHVEPPEKGREPPEREGSGVVFAISA